MVSSESILGNDLGGIISRYRITVGMKNVLRLSYYFCSAAMIIVAVSGVCAQNHLADGTKPSSSTITAPPVANAGFKPAAEYLPLVYAEGEELTPEEKGPPAFSFSYVQKGGNVTLAPGFYAAYKPKENDTLYLFDSTSEHFEKVQIHAGKEIIQGDSAAVYNEVTSILNTYDAQGRAIAMPKRGNTRSMIIRSGFIPAQGFGSKRYRFGVRPGNFKIGPNSMVSASVHMIGEDKDMGTILCAITKIDYEKNMIFVETSNEVPKGENINWIIMNAPQ